MSDMTPEKAQALLDGATPGPWQIVYYDAGDRDHYDHSGPCPSIQAPEDQDCAVVHWDGFKQKYWSSANGNQRQIAANAALIAAAPDLARAYISLQARLAEVEAERDRVDQAWCERLAAILAPTAEITRLQTDVRTYQDMVRDMTAQIEAAEKLAGLVARISIGLHQTAKDRDLSEGELAFMREADAALSTFQEAGK